MKFVSIIIPVYNESSNLTKLLEEISYTFKNLHVNFEIIIIDDASTDDTVNIIEKLKLFYNFKIKLIKNKKNYGQSYSILQGIKFSSNNTIITIDGDGQNNPADIPKLIKKYFSDEELFLVAGIRKKRKDKFIKILSSKIANKVRKFILDDNCDDTGCSLKIFDKKTFLKFPYFDGIHRFIPALFNGYSKKMCFVDVDHRKRLHGVSKYDTLVRLIKGIRDLIKVRKIIKNLK